MIEQLNRRYRKTLSDKQVTYHNWVMKEETAFFKEMTPKMENNNGCDLYIFYSSQGKLSHRAEEVIWDFFAKHPMVQMAYGDEDVEDTTDGERRLPWFKPDWSPDTFRSFFYLGSVIVVRKGIIKQLIEHKVLHNIPDNIPCRISYDEIGNNEEILELMYHIVLQCEGFAKKSHLNPTIAHIPFILYHCNSRRAIKRYLSWSKTDVIKCMLEKKRAATLSIIIPSKDNVAVLKNVLFSILEQTYLNHIEVLIIDNGSAKKNKEEIENFIEDICHDNSIEINYNYEPMDFNFSEMCNKGAQLAKGEYLLFLNDDVTLCQQDTLTIMAKHASANYTGMVGLKLYYPNSIQIQHAGISNLPMGPVHKLQFLTDDRNYYFGRNIANYNVLAVTGACFMVEKRKFVEAGGFFEKLQVAFNDVDLCFSLEKLGYYNMLLNSCYAYHHESLSRGGDETEEKLSRLMEERTKLYARHPQLEGKDPYYPYQLNHNGLDTRIRPAYITAKNYVTPAVAQPITDRMDSINEYREDACLLISIEQSNPHVIQGYSVVLGDNNACYDKQIVLKLEPQNDELIETKDWLIVGPLLPQYRPDLEENMPDQQNVALSGFAIRLDCQVAKHETPKKYRIGIIARHKITKTKLINWTNIFFPLV